MVFSPNSAERSSVYQSGRSTSLSAWQPERGPARPPLQYMKMTSTLPLVEECLLPLSELARRLREHGADHGCIEPGPDPSDAVAERSVAERSTGRSLVDLCLIERSLVGGKAANLVRLGAAGLPLPDGVVITTAVHGLAPAPRASMLSALAAAITARMGNGPFAVRSSATLEDSPTAAAPGVFVSHLGVTAETLCDAITAVWASARTPAVRSYARVHGLSETPQMAVIVQREIRGGIAGVGYTRSPDGPGMGEGSQRSGAGGDRLDEKRPGMMMLEVHGHGESEGASAAIALRIPRPTEAGGGDGARYRAAVATALAGSKFPLGLDAVCALAALLIRAEVAIDAATGADVEWLVTPEDGHTSALHVVQARAIVSRSAAPQLSCPPEQLAFSRREPDVVWHWDVHHNPDPLSPAQAGLVECMNERSEAPWRMRVVGGYLYWAKPPSPSRMAAQNVLADEPRIKAADPESMLKSGPESWPQLSSLFAELWRPRMLHELQRGDGADVGLSAAVAAYGGFYRIYCGALGDAVSRCRSLLPTFLRRYLGPAHGHHVDVEALVGALLRDRSPARLETWLTDVGNGKLSFAQLLAEAGAMAPAWDVAVPTYAERPQLLRDAVAAAQSQSRPSADGIGTPAWALDYIAARTAGRWSSEEKQVFEHALVVARMARDVGELDDRLFAQAQAMVRRALLGLARRWGLPQPDDIFFVPLHDVLAWEASGKPPSTSAIHQTAEAGRTARDRQRQWRMPLSFSAGKPCMPQGLDDRARDGETHSERHSERQSDTWYGRGVGGQVHGRVLRPPDLADLVDALHLNDSDPGHRGHHGFPHRDREHSGEATVLVVATITPGMAIPLQHVQAVVAAHGGLLDHGAAMARELAIPCVVGCAGAWHHLNTGDRVFIDGDHGMVTRLI